MLRVVGIAGSLRRASFNRALLNAARELAPEGMTIDVADISAIPLCNGDLDVDGARPVPVEPLKTDVANADGVLIVATPRERRNGRLRRSGRQSRKAELGARL